MADRPAKKSSRKNTRIVKRRGVTKRAPKVHVGVADLPVSERADAGVWVCPERPERPESNLARVVKRGGKRLGRRAENVKHALSEIDRGGLRVVVVGGTFGNLFRDDTSLMPE